MPLKSKYFRIATEGDTTDGRVIERSWLQQMAANYDRSKYGARIWLEHMRSLFADGLFPALGDVAALETREVEDGKLALFAQIEPLPELVKMNQSGQKIYTSMEVDTDFAKTGEAYLVGLAVTDTPASLGTEMLAFSSKHPDATPFNARKQRVENLFSAAQEAALEFEETRDKPSLADRVKQLFSKAQEQQKRTDANHQDFRDALDVVVEHVTELQQQVREHAGADDAESKTQLAKLSAQLDALQTRFSELTRKLQLEDADPDSRRKPTAGGTAEQFLTDC